MGSQSQEGIDTPLRRLTYLDAWDARVFLTGFDRAGNPELQVVVDGDLAKRSRVASYIEWHGDEIDQEIERVLAAATTVEVIESLGMAVKDFAWNAWGMPTVTFCWREGCHDELRSNVWAQWRAIRRYLRQRAVHPSLV